MGEILEMINEGTLCNSCGCLMEDLIIGNGDELKEAPGYPRTCDDCLEEEEK